MAVIYSNLFRILFNAYKSSPNVPAGLDCLIRLTNMTRTESKLRKKISTHYLYS